MKKASLLLFFFCLIGCLLHGSITITPGTSSDSLKRITDHSINRASCLDRKFGKGGLVKQPFLTNNVFDLPAGLIIQPDKKIVIAGYSGNPITNQWKMTLVRYYPSGEIDYSFGSDGRVINQFSDHLYDQINTAIQQADGSILIGGETSSSAGEYKFLLARYTSFGYLDTAYGQKGKVSQPFIGSGLSDEINDLCLQSNNYSIAIGHSRDAGGRKIALARYTSSGLLDTTFGASGILLQPFLGDQHLDSGVAGAVCSDGTILVAGTTSDGGIGQLKCVILCYSAIGNLVTTFGNSGVVLQPFIGTDNRDEITCMALQADGSVLVGGFSFDQGGQKGLLIRYKSNGVLDCTFGIGGIMKQPFLGAGVTVDHITALALQSDGKIIAVGSTDDGGGSKFFIARYQINGILDPSFGVGGVAKGCFVGGEAGDELRDIVLSLDGTLLALGYTQEDDGSKMFLLRALNPVDFSCYKGQLGGFYG